MNVILSEVVYQPVKLEDKDFGVLIKKDSLEGIKVYVTPKVDYIPGMADLPGEGTLVYSSFSGLAVVLAVCLSDCSVDLSESGELNIVFANGGAVTITEGKASQAYVEITQTSGVAVEYCHNLEDKLGVPVIARVVTSLADAEINFDDGSADVPVENEIPVDMTVDFEELERDAELISAKSAIPEETGFLEEGVGEIVQQSSRR